MSHPVHGVLAAIVLSLGVYSVAKFLFFLLPYATRRAALDKAYRGRAAATDLSDPVLLILATALGAALLIARADPIALLGGLFIGATLIQLFFHAFHVPVPRDRAAPEPSSPLKQMSYAIQDRPGRAIWQMAIYAGIVVAGIALYVAG